MRTIAAVAIFMTAFAVTANMHVYVQSLRIGIHGWHVFLPTIPIHLTLALMMGNLLKTDRPTLMYYLWATVFLLSISASIMSTGVLESRGTSEAIRYATIIGISLSFLSAAQNRFLATAGALGIALATITAASVSVAEFLNPNFTAIVDQLFDHDKIKEGVITRVGGLHINPNTNARFISLGMFVSCFFIPQKFRLIFCSLVGAAVFTTASRSGILTWGLAMMMLIFLGQFSSGKLFTKSIGFIGICTLGLLLTTGQIPKVMETTGLDEFMSKNMLERVSSGFFDQQDESTTTRKELAALALEIYTDNPILGAGPGQSVGLGDIGLGSHNTALQIAAEYGTLGLLSYFGLFLIPLILRSSKAICFFILFNFSLLFAHGVLTNAAIAFILPTGIVLLSKLDMQQRGSRRRRRLRSSRFDVTTTA